MNQEGKNLSTNCPPKFRMIILNPNREFLSDENFVKSNLSKVFFKKSRCNIDAFVA